MFEGKWIMSGLIFCAVTIFSSISVMNAQNPNHNLQTLKIKNSKQLHRFFQYRKGDRPLISGHRGGMVKGKPENSIEAMEYTLRHTPAFFEIDPRLTKDSVIVLMHDDTLDRTTNGQGKVSDHTLAELKKLRLKDKFGELTEYQIPTLEEAIRWAKGKTILNLDKKDVPFGRTVEIIQRLDAAAHVMVTVHTADQAAYYLERIPNIMFSAFVRTLDAFDAYEEAGVPWSQVMAYVGPEWDPAKQKLYDQLHEHGVKYMISTAPSADHLEKKEDRAAAYRQIIQSGTDVIESDLPVEVSEAIQPMIPKRSGNKKYFRSGK